MCSVRFSTITHIEIRSYLKSHSGRDRLETNIPIRSFWRIHFVLVLVDANDYTPRETCQNSTHWRQSSAHTSVDFWNQKLILTYTRRWWWWRRQLTHTYTNTYTRAQSFQTSMKLNIWLSNKGKTFPTISISYDMSFENSFHFVDSLDLVFVFILIPPIFCTFIRFVCSFVCLLMLSLNNNHHECFEWLLLFCL